MLARGHYYPEQAGAAEPVVLFIRRHWFSFASWMVLITVMAVSPIVLVSLITSGTTIFVTSLTARTLLVLALSAYYLFTLAVFLVAWIDYYLDTTIVTRRRLVDIHQNGLFNHRVSEQSLLRVQDVSVRIQGPFQTFFQFGSVYVETAGEAPNFMMRNLPHPHHVANIILELHNRLVQEGFRPEDLAIGDGDPSGLSRR